MQHALGPGRDAVSPGVGIGVDAVASAQNGAHGDRRDKHAVRADVHVVADDRPVLATAVVRGEPEFLHPVEDVLNLGLGSVRPHDDDHDSLSRKNSRVGKPLAA